MLVFKLSRKTMRGNHRGKNLGPVAAEDLFKYHLAFSLFCRYFHGICSPQLASSIPTPQIFNRLTRFSSSPNQLFIPFCKTVSFNSSSFHRTSRLCNSLLANIFQGFYSPRLFKSRIDSHLPNPDET